MGESLGSAVLDLRTDDKGLSSGLDRAKTKADALDKKFKATEKTLLKLGSSLKNAGKGMTVFVTAPLVGLGALAVKLANVQIQAERGLAAALKFAGDSSGRALADFKEFASGLQDVTTVGDETTLQMLQVATSMGLSADSAKSAVKEAIGLSAAFGIAESTAIRMTASLADGDTTMLNRYIPTLKGVKDETERVALAHEILGGAFGVATAAAESGLGPWKQVSNQFGDLLEDFGAFIIEGLKPLVGHLKTGIKWVQNLSDSQKKWVVIIAAVAAAIGPVLIGVGSFIGILGTLAGAMASGGALAGGFALISGAVVTLATFLTGPVGIAIAIGIVLLKFKPFRNLLVSITGFFVAFAKKGISLVVEGFKKLVSFMQPVIDKLRAVASLIGGFLGKSFDIATVAINKLATGGETLDATIITLTKGVIKLAPELPPLATNIAEVGDKADDATTKVATLEEILGKLGFTTAAQVVTEVDNLVKAFEEGGVPIEQMGKKVQELILKYESLGLLSPEVKEKLESITTALVAQGEELTTETLIALGRYEEVLGRLEASRIAEWQEGWTSSVGDTEGAVFDLGETTEEFTFNMPSGIEEVTTAFNDMFVKVKTGIPFFDDLINKGLAWIQSLTQGIPGLNTLFGKLFGKDGNIASLAQQLFGGGKGSIGGIIGSALGGPLGAIVLNLGMQMAQKLWGALKSVFSTLFGGATAEELAGREIAAEFRNTIADMLDSMQLAEAGTDEWKKSVIGLRDIFIAFGKSEAEALAFSEALWKAEAEGPEAVAALIEQIGPMMEQVQAAMVKTGLSLTDLRNLAINNSISMGISVSEAFQLILNDINEVAEAGKSAWRLWAEDAGISFEKFEGKSKKELRAIVDAMGLSAEASKRVFRAMLDKQAADQKDFNKTQRDKFRDMADDLKLNEEDKAAYVKANMKLRREELRAADKEAWQIRRDEVKAFKKAQRKMAKGAEDAARRSWIAWETSARKTVDAWDWARNETVGSSSILDIERLGSAAAGRLEDSHAQAALSTGARWEEQTDSMSKFMARMTEANRLSSAATPNSLNKIAVSTSVNFPPSGKSAVMQSTLHRVAEEMAGLRRELRTQIPRAAGIAARHAVQTSGRKNS